MPVATRESTQTGDRGALTTRGFRRISDFLIALEQSRSFSLIALSVLGLQVAIIHLRWIHNFFGTADDIWSLERNHLPWSEVWKVFHPHFDVAYRPLMELGFFLCQKAFGLHPEGFHAVSYVIHWLTCFLFFLLARRLLQSGFWALTAALLFGAYPRYTEAVQWTSGNQNLFAGTAFVASVLCFVKWRDSGHRGYFAGCLLAFAAGLLSKEEVVALPVVLVAIDRALYQRPMRAREWRWLLPFVVLFSGYLALVIMNQTHSIGTNQRGNYGEFFGGMDFRKSVRMAFIFVSELTFTHAGMTDLSLTAALCGSLLYLCWRASPITRIACVWMLLTALIPPATTGQHVQGTDRFFYLPAMPFALLIAAAVQLCCARFSNDALSPTKMVALLLVVAYLIRMDFVPPGFRWRSNESVMIVLVAACVLGAALLPRWKQDRALAVWVLAPIPLAVAVMPFMPFAPAAHTAVIAPCLIQAARDLRRGTFRGAEFAASLLVMSLIATYGFSVPILIALATLVLVMMRSERGHRWLPLCLLPVLITWSINASHGGKFWQIEGEKILSQLDRVTWLKFDPKYYR